MAIGRKTFNYFGCLITVKSSLYNVKHDKCYCYRGVLKRTKYKLVAKAKL